jgi:hypothetical protein
MNRRLLLQGLLASGLGPCCKANAGPLQAAVGERIATAWQRAGQGTDADVGHHVGVFRVDWAAARIALETALPVPTRAHGLLALPDGGFAAVANRPGPWLWRVDAEGQVQARADSPTGRSFNGHVEASADGQWLFTTETHTASQTGWVSVRNASTLAQVAEFSSAGIDPHQLLLAADGSLMVANGGILRDANGRKQTGERMAPSLVRIHPTRGTVLGHWTLPDEHLSMRHMAWASGGEPRLGLALQAEHADPRERAAAPALAVWDGQSLTLPCTDTAAAGYVGDIAAGPDGGFVLSAQKQGCGLWWQPGAPERFTRMAELTEPCALVASAQGVLLGSGRGLARWQRDGPSAMLRWPVPLAPDNHAVRLL